MRQFRLRTLMIVVAFAALILTVAMQGVLLRRAAVREEMIRAEAEHALALSMMKSMQASVAAEQAVERAEELARELKRKQ